MHTPTPSPRLPASSRASFAALLRYVVYARHIRMVMRAAAVRVVRISERRGRGLVAARAVRAGDVVVEDRPIAIGADIAAPRCGTCAGVHDDDDAGRRACESDNAGRRWLAGIDWTSGPLFPAMAGELQIARILGRINRVWDEGLSRLCHATIADDHDGVRDDWRKVVARVTSLMSRGTAEDILPFDTFRRLLGVLHLNCLAVGDADRHVGTVLMGTLSFVNHSCCPNAKVGWGRRRRRSAMLTLSTGRGGFRPARAPAAAGRRRHRRGRRADDRVRRPDDAGRSATASSAVGVRLRMRLSPVPPTAVVVQAVTNVRTAARPCVYSSAVPSRCMRNVR